VIKDAIAKLIDGKDLKGVEAYEAMKEIMSGAATPSQIAGFLVALRVKGEKPGEIAGCALSMRDAAMPLALSATRIVDTCGTGGDGKAGLNVSTAAAFVVAGAGFTVAKHGNRAISSKCGSADVLEKLGVRIDPPVAVVEECLNKIGIGFLFAPNFHPAMKNAMPTRRELGVRTVFNLLGPLTNPARAKVQLIGVFHKELVRPIAHVMHDMGHLAGLAVHSNGWDEVTLDNVTNVAELFKGRVKTYNWTHRNFGLPKVSSRHLAGSDGETNAGVIRTILEGKKIPARDVIVANAAALIWIAERAFSKKDYSLKDAVNRATNSIDSGAALTKCGQLAEISRMIEP
jgi:anthranilate phosphoribosyltransferase